MRVANNSPVFSISPFLNSLSIMNPSYTVRNLAIDLISMIPKTLVHLLCFIPASSLFLFCMRETISGLNHPI